MNDVGVIELPKAADMRILDDNKLDKDHILADISTRCESQHKFDLHLLGQRFGVLSGTPSLDSADIPVGPKMLCSSFDDALTTLMFDANSIVQICYLFEQFILNDFGELLRACNTYLAEQGVLPNLTYVPFRHSDKRHRASPKALDTRKQRGAQATAEPNRTNASTHTSNAELISEPSSLEKNFQELHYLMRRQRQLLNKLNAHAENYLENSVHEKSGLIKAMSPQKLDNLLAELQARLHIRADHANLSIQHIKHDLLAQLHNSSNEDQLLQLAPEDNDAIDFIGLLMDSVLKHVSPGSAGSRLLHQIQVPLMRLAIKDKSFFDNRSHPARRLMNMLTDIGLSWLYDVDNEHPLRTGIDDVLTRTLLDAPMDRHDFLKAYTETKLLLQIITAKASSIERRQIETARGKERIKAARSHALATVRKQLSGQTLDRDVEKFLDNTWVDVLTLTELRSGKNSEQWQKREALLQEIIGLQQGITNTPAPLSAETRNLLADTLSIVGLHGKEIDLVVNRLMGISNDNSIISALVLPKNTPTGASHGNEEVERTNLTPQQQLILQDILALPIGTWFEMITPESSKPSRQKLAWMSDITNTALFVNQAGYKTVDLPLHKLAIDIFEGKTRQVSHTNEALFDKAFAAVLLTLQDLASTQQGTTDV